jgi:hypothetical protein
VSDTETRILWTQFCKQLVYTTLDSYVEESHEVNVRYKKKASFPRLLLCYELYRKSHSAAQQKYLLEIKQFWAQKGKCETVVPNLFEYANPF